MTKSIKEILNYLPGDEKQKTAIAISISVISVPIIYIIYRRIRSKILHIPNGPISPFGSIKAIKKDPKKFFKKMGDKYGKISSFTFGNKDIILLNDSNLIRTLWSKPEFFARQEIYIPYCNVSNAKMFVSISDKPWLHRRKLASNTLFSLLNNDFVQKNGENIIINQIFKNINQCINNNTLFYGEKYFQFYTFNMIAMVTLGNNINLDINGDLVTGTTKLINDFFYLLQPYLFLNFFPLLNMFSNYYNGKQIEQVFSSIYNAVAGIAIDYKSKNYKSNQINNYLDMMLKAIDDKEIGLEEAVMDVVLFFGTGTVASALTMQMGILYGAQNRKLQNEIAQELKQLHGNNKMMNIQLISQCHLLNAFVYETLRMTCPVPIPFAHQCTKDTIVMNPDNNHEQFNIKKGDLVLANMYYVHRETNENWGNNYQIFDINRWLDNNKNFNREQTSNLLTFSHGGRGCIGKQIALTEILLMLGNLFMNYDFYFDDNKMNHIDLDNYRNFNGFYWKLNQPVGVKVQPRK